MPSELIANPWAIFTTFYQNQRPRRALVHWSSARVSPSIHLSLISPASPSMNSRLHPERILHHLGPNEQRWGRLSCRPQRKCAIASAKGARLRGTLMWFAILLRAASPEAIEDHLGGNCITRWHGNQQKTIKHEEKSDTKKGEVPTNKISMQSLVAKISLSISVTR